MATLAEKIATNTLTVGEAIALGPKEAVAGLRRNVKKAGVDLDSPWLEIGKGEAGVNFLKNLNKIGTQTNFTNLLTIQNNVARIASVNDLPSVPNVFGAEGKARSLKLKKAAQARETRKFKAVPNAKLAVPIIADGISKIPDAQTRTAVSILALIPFRPGEVAFGGSTKYPDTQLQVGDIDYETGTIKESIRSGKIRNPIQIPEVALEILKQAEADAVAAGRKNIFDTTVQKMTAAINAPGGIAEQLNVFEKRMGRRIQGSVDLRKIIPSIIASELGFTGDISAIMGHDDLAAVSKDLAETTSKHYVSPVFGEVTEATREQIALSALQNEMAKVLGLDHQGELAIAFNVNAPSLTQEGSPRLSIIQKDSPAPSGINPTGEVTEVETLTVEDQNLSEAKKNAKIERLNLEAEEYRQQSIKLGKANTAEEANIDLELERKAAQARLEKQDIFRQVKIEFDADKASASADAFGGFLDDAIKLFTDPTKLQASIPSVYAAGKIAGLAGVEVLKTPFADLGILATDRPRQEQVVEEGIEFAEEKGLPFPEQTGPLVGMGTEILTGGAFTDPEGAASSAQQMARLFGPLKFQPNAAAPASTPINIPDPVESGPDLAADQDANVARSQAMKNEPTSMEKLITKNDEIPSFLYGGIVR